MIEISHQNRVAVRLRTAIAEASHRAGTASSLAAGSLAVALAGLTITLQAFAQQPPDRRANQLPIRPPVRSSAEPLSAPPKLDPSSADPSSGAPTRPPGPADAPAASDESTEPTVTIRQEGETKIEEYRINGRLYATRVTPKGGVPYLLVDPDGKGHMSPVDDAPARLRPPQWTLFQF